MSTDQVIAALTTLLISSQRYSVQVATHHAECEFTSMRKALVKDMSKYVERVDKKMPTGYILTFVDFELILLVERIKASRIIPNGIILTFETYDLTLCKL